ncbi:LacI family DNA-binding transcriptional regulator [Actinomycetospora chibensis]|uniref:LacI family DNA-binding transcriptional regulator n=1 Tax=Actinomycetospora chibensis TaxID=663606 RepID=A0ABV9RCF8_9PSEU|nr:LacI family DNA-binding transcriptional regulator [Actinomycetospora chibensis]MDD7923663.1 LacI family DNA-binding transcriptional regulator [Actinomycetospora chibensis]
MATMADVARMAGVSTATVSHVLNGTRPVRASTREQVLSAVAATHYTPNTVARSLATARTTTMGLVLSAISNPYFGELLSAAESAAAAAGYTLLLVDPHEDPDYELTVVTRLHHHRVDGVVLAPSARPDDTLAYLARHQVPTVLLDRLIDAGHDQVGPENRASTAGLTDHLADHGHTRIGLVAGLEGLSTTTERREGYRDALRSRGLPVDPELEVGGASETVAARRATHRLLALDDRPTAIVAGNNSMTIGVMQALRDAGLVVPRDVAVAAFDDFAWADLFAPRLTVAAQPFDEIATTAVRLLLDRIAEPDAPPTTRRLLPRLVVRESCGCPGST